MSTTLPATLSPLPEHKAKALVTLQFREAWNQESEQAQRWLLRQWSIMEPILHARPQEPMIRIVADAHRENFGNFRKRFFAFKGGLVEGKYSPFWEKMINRRNFPQRDGKRSLSTLFLDFWKGEQERVIRLNDCGKAALRNLLARRDAWAKNPGDTDLLIPGYTAPPPLTDFCSTMQRRVPKGWSYRNMIRKKPSRYANVYIKQGPKAASGLLPDNLGTRTDLRYRRRLMIDDEQPDHRVVHFGNQGKPMRPECFHILDQYTTVHEFTGMQLRRWDREKDVERGLDQESAFWTIALDLNRNGFRTDEQGTTYVQELGTAHLPPWLWEEIHSVTGGHVFFDQSGRFDQSMMAKSILGPGAKLSAGNSRYKGAIESSFHILRTMAGDLRGAISMKERDFGPEHNPALIRYCMGLFRKIEKMPREEQHAIWDLLRLPFHTFDQYGRLLHLVMRAVDARRDHKIEGWSKCGFVLPGFMNPFSDLPENERLPLTQHQLAKMPNQVAELIMEHGTRRDLILSPTEAKEFCLRTEGPAITKLGWPRIASVVRNEWAYPRRLGGKQAAKGIRVDSKQQLKVRDTNRFGDETLIYFAFATPDRGAEFPLDPSIGYNLFIPPFAPDIAIVKTLDGRYVGTVKKSDRVGSMDRAARLEQQGQIHHYRAILEAGPKRRHTEEVEEMADDVAHNAQVIEGGIRPGEDDIRTAKLDQARADYDEAEEAGIITLDPDEIDDFDAQAAAAADLGDDPSTGSVFGHNPQLDD